jgi:hypothetical protein
VAQQDQRRAAGWVADDVCPRRSRVAYSVVAINPNVTITSGSWQRVETPARRAQWRGRVGVDDGVISGRWRYASRCRRSRCWGDGWFAAHGRASQSMTTISSGRMKPLLCPLGSPETILARRAEMLPSVAYASCGHASTADANELSRSASSERIARRRAPDKSRRLLCYAIRAGSVAAL